MKDLGLMSLSLMCNINLKRKPLDQRTHVLRIKVKGRVIPLCDIFEIITGLLKTNPIRMWLG
jgi:hypothetical protein